jgi:hypothetical protein
MATYRPAGPGLLQIQRDDGQSIVLPMEEHEAQAQGLQPEGQGPGGIPMPDMQNPYSMASSPNAVAGPGGAPTDLGTGAGVFAQKRPEEDPREIARLLTTPIPVAHETQRAPTKFDVALPGEKGGAPKAPELVPVGAPRQQQSAEVPARRAAWIRCSPNTSSAVAAVEAPRAWASPARRASTTSPAA